MKNNHQKLVGLLGAASGLQSRDPLARLARSLVFLKPAQILLAIYQSVPDGLLGTLKRVGSDPFSRFGLYSDLFRIFTNWTAAGLVDKPPPHAAALSNASGLMPPRWLWRRVRL